MRVDGIRRRAEEFDDYCATGHLKELSVFYVSGECGSHDPVFPVESSSFLYSNSMTVRTTR